MQVAVFKLDVRDTIEYFVTPLAMRFFLGPFVDGKKSRHIKMKGGRLFTEKCLIMIHVPVIPQKYTVHSQSLILVLEFSTHNNFKEQWRQDNNTMLLLWFLVGT